MIQVKNLKRYYKTGQKVTKALDGIDLFVEKADFLAITGRSGSGKSTLLYQMGLLDRPTEGEVIIDGTDVINMSNEKRNSYRLNNLGYVFQDYALIPTLSATENVIAPLIMQGLKTKVAKQKAVEALSMLGLEDRKDNMPSQLSGGEQQRVSIARAISHNPKIIFADEPTANLDSETAQVVLKALIDLNKQGLTIVMVTHEPDYAKLGNRQIVLSDGKLIKE